MKPGRGADICGRPLEALQSIQHAMRLNPYAHVIDFALLGAAYHNTEQYAESIVALKRALALTPFYPACVSAAGIQLHCANG